jgi:hypothetical protein
MSLARTISRGARLNARFGVNGTQKASRSLGTAALRRSGSAIGLPPGAIHRHARLHAGHPRLCSNMEDVDGRDKPGHDEIE